MQTKEVTTADLAQAIAALGRGIERIENRFESRFDAFDVRFDILEKRFAAFEIRFDNLETRFDNLEMRFDGFETRLSTIETRFDSLEATVENLAIFTSRGFTSTENRLDILTQEVIRNGDDIRDIKNTLREHQFVMIDQEHRITALETAAH